MEFIWSLLGFLVAISLLVFIHEYGHYAVAKFFNIKVVQFSLGFGKPFYSRQFGETQFSLSPIPLGGYVRFVDERDGAVADADLPRAFNRQSVYKRFAVVAAGPLVNLVFAWLAFSMIYLSGIQGIKPLFELKPSDSAISQALLSNPDIIEYSVWQPLEIEGRKVYGWQEVHQSIVTGLVNKQADLHIVFENFNSQERHEARVSLAGLDLNESKQDWLKILGFSIFQPPIIALVGQVVEGSPASLIGLQAGDRITALDDVVVNTWQDLVEIVRVNPNQSLPLTFERKGSVTNTTILLGSRETPEGLQGSIGVAVELKGQSLESFQFEKEFTLTEAMVRGVNHTLNLMDMTLVMVKRMLFGEVSVDNLSGPISIAQYSGQAMQSGWVAFLSLLGLLSLSLGVLNLLPIPVLDGGHLFYYVIEMLKGSPVNESVQLLGQKIGMFLILLLTFFVIFNDVVRLYNA